MTTTTTSDSVDFDVETFFRRHLNRYADDDGDTNVARRQRWKRFADDTIVGWRQGRKLLSRRYYHRHSWRNQQRLQSPSQTSKKKTSMNRNDDQPVFKATKSTTLHQVYNDRFYV